MTRQRQGSGGCQEDHNLGRQPQRISKPPPCPRRYHRPYTAAASAGPRIARTIRQASPTETVAPATARTASNASSVANLTASSTARPASIRAHDEAFAFWRARLSSGLERAHRLRDELGPDVDVAAVVAETLEDARQQVLREADRSQVLGRGGLVALVMGAFGGTVSGLGGGVSGGLLGAAGGVIPALAQGLLDRRAAEPGFVRRHYLVFDRPANGGALPDPIWER